MSTERVLRSKSVEVPSRIPRAIGVQIPNNICPNQDLSLHKSVLRSGKTLQIIFRSQIYKVIGKDWRLLSRIGNYL
jgi:hypothetical protein